MKPTNILKLSAAELLKRRLPAFPKAIVVAFERDESPSDKAA